MENDTSFMINNKIYTNNTNLLLEAINKFESFIKDMNNNILIQRIKDIIIIMNKAINENKKTLNLIRKDIENLI